MRTLFISDLHLSEERPAITELFLRFCAEEAPGAEALYILGDLFEIWLGDDFALPHYDAPCRALAQLAAGGTPVYFIAGNRDFLLGPGGAARCGMTLLAEPAVVNLYGTPTVLLPGEAPGSDIWHRLVRDVAREVIYPNLKALAQAGADFLRLDEPAATTHPDEVPDFVQATIDSVGDLKGRVTFGMHICFSDYSLLMPHLRELEGVIHEMHFEYANRDSREPGVSPEVRVGYTKTLNLLKDTRFIVGLGVLDVHTNFIEPVELIRDRILYALDVIQDPERIYVAPDCGLRTRTWDVAFAKLRNMVEAVEQVKAKLGI